MTTTSKNFALHQIETAPRAARPTLEAAKKGFGMVPNLHKVLAEAPAALEGYATLWSVFETSSFTPAERQIVYLTSNFENECRYCLAGHSVLAKGAGVPDDAIEAIREGRPIADARLEALRSFTSKIVVNRGWLLAATSRRSSRPASPASRSSKSSSASPSRSSRTTRTTSPTRRSTVS